MGICKRCNKDKRFRINGICRDCDLEVDEVLQKFEELEESIKNENAYQRCPDYCKGCVQCKFWKNFDKLKKHFHGGQNND